MCLCIKEEMSQRIDVIQIKMFLVSYWNEERDLEYSLSGPTYEKAYLSSLKCLHRRFDDKGVLMRKEIAAETLTSIYPIGEENFGIVNHRLRKCRNPWILIRKRICMIFLIKSRHLLLKFFGFDNLTRPASCSKKISLAVLFLRADVLLTHDCFSCDVELLVMSKGIPKETNPPLVLKSSKGSPLSSGGGMGDQIFIKDIKDCIYSISRKILQYSEILKSKSGTLSLKSLEKQNMYQHGYEVWKFDSLEYYQVQQSPQHPSKLALPSAWCMMTTRMIAGLLGTVVELILTSSYVVDQLLKTEYYRMIIRIILNILLAAYI
ncbi:hypothetical protein NC652_025132 [Populus alba x Populus x berolinensis]|nr:hypothetical protein NC652_025132 [Populus alba x Populus x berolinensis]